MTAPAKETPKDEKGAEPAAYFYRFHTDDSLAGKPNVRPWVLDHGQPTPGLYKECEIRLLYATPPGELDSARVRADLYSHIKRLELALGGMLTYFGMDEDEWSKPVFDVARAALASLKGSSC
jgi:hypothetical protein